MRRNHVILHFWTSAEPAMGFERLGALTRDVHHFAIQKLSFLSKSHRNS